jgi:hypothetical protein
MIRLREDAADPMIPAASIVGLLSVILPMRMFNSITVSRQTIILPQDI